MFFLVYSPKGVKVLNITHDIAMSRLLNRDVAIRLVQYSPIMNTLLATLLKSGVNIFTIKQQVVLFLSWSIIHSCGSTCTSLGSRVEIAGRYDGGNLAMSSSA
jgi:hypothetical protein